MSGWKVAANGAWIELSILEVLCHPTADKGMEIVGQLHVHTVGFVAVRLDATGVGHCCCVAACVVVFRIRLFLAKPTTKYSQKKARALEESSDQLRRVFLHYRPGKHDNCSKTIQRENAAHEKPTSIRVHYDIPKLSAFVVTATNAEIEKMASDPDVDRVVEDPIRTLFRTERRRLLEWPGQATP